MQNLFRALNSLLIYYCTFYVKGQFKHLKSNTYADVEDFDLIGID